MRPCRRNGDGLAQVPNLSIPLQEAGEGSHQKICAGLPESTFEYLSWSRMV